MEAPGDGARPGISHSLDFPQGGKTPTGVVLAPAGVGDDGETILTYVPGSVRVTVSDKPPFWQIWPRKHTLAVSLRSGLGQLYSRDPSEYADNEAMLSLSHLGEHEAGLVGDTSWTLDYEVKAPPWILLASALGLCAVIVFLVWIWIQRNRPLKMAFWAETGEEEAEMVSLRPGARRTVFPGNIGLPSDFDSAADEVFAIERRGATFVVSPGNRTTLHVFEQPESEIELPVGGSGTFTVEAQPDEIAATPGVSDAEETDGSGLPPDDVPPVGVRSSTDRGCRRRASAWTRLPASSTTYRRPSIQMTACGQEGDPEWSNPTVSKSRASPRPSSSAWEARGKTSFSGCAS